MPVIFGTMVVMGAVIGAGSADLAQYVRETREVWLAVGMAIGALNFIPVYLKLR